jgi:hypothetical protein
MIRLILFLFGIICVNANVNLEIGNTNAIDTSKKIRNIIENKFLTRCSSTCDTMVKQSNALINLFYLNNRTNTIQINYDSECNENMNAFDINSYYHLPQITTSSNELMCVVSKYNFNTDYTSNDFDSISIVDSYGSAIVTYPHFYNTMHNLINHKNWFKYITRSPVTTLFIIDYTTTIQTQNLIDIIKVNVREYCNRLFEKDDVGMIIHKGNVDTDIVKIDIESLNELKFNEIMNSLDNTIAFGSNNKFDKTIEKGIDMMSNIKNTKVNNIVIVGNSNTIHGFDDESDSIKNIISHISNISFAIHTVDIKNTNTNEDENENENINIFIQLSCMTGGVYINDNNINDIFEMINSESSNVDVIISDQTDFVTNRRNTFFASSIYDKNFIGNKLIGSVIVSSHQEIPSIILKNVKFNYETNTFNGTFELLDKKFKVYNPNGLGICEREQLRKNKCNIDICSKKSIPTTCSNRLRIGYRNIGQFQNYLNTNVENLFLTDRDLINSLNCVDTKYNITIRIKRTKWIDVNDEIIGSLYQLEDFSIESSNSSINRCIINTGGVVDVKYHSWATMSGYPSNMFNDCDMLFGEDNYIVENNLVSGVNSIHVSYSYICIILIFIYNLW